MKIEIAVFSDMGTVRTNNEDNLYHDGRVKEDVTLSGYQYQGIQEIVSGSPYAVFDGMGGLAHGEIASLVAGMLRK